jgi:hypothetical protein
MPVNDPQPKEKKNPEILNGYQEPISSFVFLNDNLLLTFHKYLSKLVSAELFVTHLSGPV